MHSNQWKFQSVVISNVDVVFPWKLIGVFFWFYQSNIDRNWITERIWSLIYQLNSNRRRQRKSKVSNPHLERSFTIVAVILTDRPLFRKRLQIHPEASSSRETTKIIKRKRSQFPRSVRNVKPDRQTLRENDRVQGKRLCDRPHCAFFSGLTLVKIGHPFRSREWIGPGKMNIWVQYEQILSMDLWEKSKKLLKLPFLPTLADRFWHLRFHIASPSIPDDLI